MLRTSRAKRLAIATVLALIAAVLTQKRHRHKIAKRLPGRLGGGMAEWTIAAVLKTAGRKPRGFESLSLRKKLITLPFLVSDSIIFM